MKYEKRQYQIDTVKAWWKDLHVEGCKPVIALPTGSGKSVILGMLLKKYFKKYPHNSVLIMSHTEQILRHDFDAVTAHVPDAPISFYSASIGEKEVSQITIGGVQTVVHAKEKFMWTDLIIVDEVHAVSHKQEGSYRKILDGAYGKVTGMSATVFRTGHGYIHEGKGTLFNKLSIDLTRGKAFTDLIDQGYLSDLVAVSPAAALNSDGVKMTGSDFNLKALAARHDRPAITNAILKDATTTYLKKYNKWLVFAIDIQHCEHITSALRELGVSTELVHSEMTGDDNVVIDAFKKGEFTALVSVGKLTTGFDVPDVDAILMLRPTVSPVLHVQMWGRGTRAAKGKRHCLALDYAGNFLRLGPINNVKLPTKSKGSSGGAPVMKVCPECRTLAWPSQRVCNSCGHKFVFKTKLKLKASTAEAVERKVKKGPTFKWYKVVDTVYHLQTFRNKKPVVVVKYICNKGLKTIVQYLMVEHTGYAQFKAMHILKNRGYNGEWKAHKVIEASSELRKVTHILADTDGKYPSIKSVRLK